MEKKPGSRNKTKKIKQKLEEWVVPGPACLKQECEA
jgi:hypothetical protein